MKGAFALGVLFSAGCSGVGLVLRQALPHLCGRWASLFRRSSGFSKLLPWRIGWS